MASVNFNGPKIKRTIQMADVLCGVTKIVSVKFDKTDEATTTTTIAPLETDSETVSAN